jgi:hypothetical protein
LENRKNKNLQSRELLLLWLEILDVKKIALGLRVPDRLDPHVRLDLLEFHFADHMAEEVIRPVQLDEPVGVGRVGGLAGEGKIDHGIGVEDPMVADGNPLFVRGGETNPADLDGRNQDFFALGTANPIELFMILGFEEKPG